MFMSNARLLLLGTFVDWDCWGMAQGSDRWKDSVMLDGEVTEDGILEVLHVFNVFDDCL